MTEHPWTARHWPDPWISITDVRDARAAAPDAAGDSYEDWYAWYWHTENGSIVAVTKVTGSVHETTQPFTTLQDAAGSFHAYFPLGLFWEDLGTRQWMAHLAAKYNSPGGHVPLRESSTPASLTSYPAETG